MKQLIGAALVAVALSASGCGSGESREESQLLPSGLGADLVRRAENVRATLGDGDGCTALDQAKELRRAIVRAIAQRRVPPELQPELRRRANELVSSVVCVPAPPPAIQEAEDDEKDHDEKGGPKKDKRGKKGRRGKEGD